MNCPLANAEQLIPVRTPEGQRLATEIAVLREALEMVTPDAPAAVVYGRIDDAIQQRQAALFDEYRRQQCALTHEQQLAEVHTRG